MRKISYLLLFSLSMAACKSGQTDDFGIAPGSSAYNDEARVIKKTYTMSADKPDDIYSEERFSYNTNGKLSRIDRYQYAMGKADPVGYQALSYNANGEQIGRAHYYKNGANGWIMGSRQEFDYENGVLKTEKAYYYPQDRKGEKVFTNAIAYAFKDGKKVGQKYFNDQNQLIHEVVYAYSNDILNRETWYNEKGIEIRFFEHKFSGNRRQIGEYIPTLKDQIALIEKTYDAEGRILTEYTKVNNAMLCAMMPGFVRYHY